MNTIKRLVASLILVATVVLFLYSIWWKSRHPGSRIIEYADTYTNAKAFRDEFMKVKNVDSMFTKDKLSREFLSDKVKIIRNRRNDMQAISIPIDTSKGDYYLIINDSIFRMKIQNIR